MVAASIESLGEENVPTFLAIAFVNHFLSIFIAGRGYSVQCSSGSSSTWPVFMTSVPFFVRANKQCQPISGFVDQPHPGHC